MSAPATDLGRATADLIDALTSPTGAPPPCSPTTWLTPRPAGAVDGADAYLDLCHGWREAFPDVVGTITDSAAAEGLAVLQIRWQGTHTGPLETRAGPVLPSGNRVMADASFWARFEGDRIHDMRHHLDVLTLLQQVGAMAG